MNFKVIARNVGKALLVSALFLFLSLLVSIYDGMDEGFAPLCISFTITLLVGAFPFIFGRDVPDTKLEEGFWIIALSWFLSFFFGMMPYVLYGGEFTVVNAWFESVSGYTTTGSTILKDIEALPRSLLFWRSSTHFIGGLGVVVFLLLVLSDSSPFKLRLSNLEISSMSKTGYRYKAGKTARVMLTVYIGLTLAEILLLSLAGMSLFDAVNHSFSTVSTGGFSTKNLSIMHYDSPLIDVILTVFMILSSLHFGVIFAIFAKRSLAPLKSSVTRYYRSVILILSLMVSVILKTQGDYQSWGRALLDGTFQVSSYITTTGFGQADNAVWPFLANLLLLFATFHCGCSGSTTGGVKADRMLIAFKEIHNEIRRRLHPSSLFPTRLDGQVLKKEALSSVFLYIVMYIFIFMLSFIVVLFCGVDVADAFSGTLASIGNVGPGIGSLGTLGNYADLPVVAKFVFTFDMFLGRVEIFPLLIVINRSLCFWNRSRI
jgi:trk system potassium uptake protein TrkH